MNNIRIVIGNKEIYPMDEMINMGDSEVCMIQLKLKVLGGMRNGRLSQHEANILEWRRKDRNIYEPREKTATDN